LIATSSLSRHLSEIELLLLNPPNMLKSSSPLQANQLLMQEMSGRQTPTTLIPLTCAQIHLVRSLWRQIYTSKGPTVIGTSIYHRLCFKCPQVKEQIRRVPLPPKFQNYDSFIKAHSKAIGELIDQVVDNLDNLDNMAGELIRVGQVHAKLLRGELTGKLWNVVAETFIDCTLEWGDRRCRSETVRKAWALIVAFVIEKIKVGHHEQRKKMLATRQSLPAIQVPFQSMKI
uniref:GLOBIN domain-containing protein n=1 Tax=Haemonchus contortus TaxID=6289 RepID=A0A7I4XUF9_HAECO